ncbi:unnamed protein product [Sphagnum jensenii]|uniref:Uncharacterized protein n=1 Tax=Sphagnum jensenii TaxID=128206 RepID=A0ABP0VJ95_9BRYO
MIEAAVAIKIAGIRNHEGTISKNGLTSARSGLVCISTMHPDPDSLARGSALRISNSPVCSCGRSARGTRLSPFYRRGDRDGRRDDAVGQ